MRRLATNQILCIHCDAVQSNFFELISKNVSLVIVRILMLGIHSR